jgi:hypothetical protein
VKRGAVVHCGCHCGCDGSRDGRATKRGSSAAGPPSAERRPRSSSSVATQLACDAQSSAMASAWRTGVELLVLAKRFEVDDGAELELSLRLWMRTGVLAARRTALALAAAQASWCVVYAPGFALLALLLLPRTVCTQPLHHHVPQSDTVQHNQPSPSRAGFQYGTLRTRSQPVHSTWPDQQVPGRAQVAARRRRRQLAHHVQRRRRQTAS